MELIFFKPYIYDHINFIFCRCFEERRIKVMLCVICCGI
jgi:hypothetical protein